MLIDLLVAVAAGVLVALLTAGFMRWSTGGKATPIQRWWDSLSRARQARYTLVYLLAVPVIVMIPSATELVMRQGDLDWPKLFGIIVALDALFVLRLLWPEGRTQQ